MPYRSLRAACCFGYFVSGLLLTVIGPVLPAMQAGFGLTFAQVGPMFLAQSGGFALAVLIGGAASDRLGRRPVLLLGGAVNAAALLGFLIPGGWLLALLWFFLSGVGFGLLDSSLNALAVDLNPGDEGRALNLLHLFPAAGAVLGPFLGGALVGYGWRWALASVGLLAAAFLAWVGFERFPPPGPAAPPAAGREGGSSIFLHPLVFSLAVLLSLYVGVELAVSGWTVTYASVVMAVPERFGAGITSLFWIGIGMGRVLSRLALRRLHPLLLIAWSGAGALASLLAALGAAGASSFAAAIGLAGLFLGSVFPTVVAYAGASFPGRVGTVTGFVIASCSVGGALIPALVGVVADRIGMEAGLITVVATAAMMLLSAWAARAVAGWKRLPHGAAE